jgi:hypothetical protein
MDSQEINITKNKRGRPLTGQGTSLILRLHPQMLDALDNWIGAQPGKKVSRQKAIYLFMEEKLGVPNK